MYARVPQAMAQFALKIEKLSHIMGPTPILEMARAYGLRPWLWLLYKVKDRWQSSWGCILVKVIKQWLFSVFNFFMLQCLLFGRMIYTII